LAVKRTLRCRSQRFPDRGSLLHSYPAVNTSSSQPHAPSGAAGSVLIKQEYSMTGHYPSQEKLVCFLETLQTYQRLRKRLTDLAQEDPKLVLLYTDTLRDHLTELADGGLLAELDEIAFEAMVKQDQANRTASPHAAN
jgi:hypothetical protein